MERGDVIENAPDYEPYEDRDGWHAQRKFDVVARSPVDAFNWVSRKFGLQRGTLYRSPFGEVLDLRLHCERRSCMRKGREQGAPIGGVGRYILTYDFEIPSGGGREPEPVVGAAVYEWGGQTRVEPVDTDANGDPITNSAGEPYDPPLSAPIPYTTLDVKWYVAKFSPMTIVNYQGAILSTSWTPNDPDGEGATLQQWQAQCAFIKRAKVNDGLLLVHASFEIAPYFKILTGDKVLTDATRFFLTPHDRGYRVKVSDGPPPVYRALPDGSQPVYLDGAGGLGDPSSPHQRLIRPAGVQLRNFADLGI